MQLFPGVPEDPEDDTVMEKIGAIARYPAMKSLVHAIWTENQDARQDAAHRMIQNAIPWTIRRCSESNNAYGKLLVWMPKDNAHLVDLK